MTRTSVTHPLKIAAIRSGLFSGEIGVTFAPGKRDPHSMSGGWARDLNTDLDVIRAWNAKTVVTLIEDHEFDLLDIRPLGEAVRRRGMDWVHMPIRDVDIPGATFEAAWPERSVELLRRLAGGDNVLIHCRGGLGRAGMIAARLLVDAGADPDDAIGRVRRARPGAIETSGQENWVRRGAPPGIERARP